MTVYWVVWDAAAQWIVDRLDREGALPAVRRLRSSGWSGGARPPAPNCQTPPSLATLFTGTWPVRHGVTGFTVPDASGVVTAHRPGFDPVFPLVPPVWEVLAAERLRAAFVHVPWVFGEESMVGPYVDAAIEAYSQRLARPEAITAEPGGRVSWQVAGYPVEVTGDAAGVQLATAHGRSVLTPAAGWTQVLLGPDGDGEIGVWVRCMPAGGHWRLARTGVWRVRVAGADRALVSRLSAGPVFVGEGVGPLYRAGTFGPTLAGGGDGSAEEVLLSSLKCVARSVGAAADAVLRQHHADLVGCYLAITDDIGHALIGWCDEQSAAYRPDIAATAWRVIRRCYQLADDLLGRVLDRASPADTVILSADHGMVGSTHTVHLNEQLLRCGLAGRTEDGELDPERCAVVYHPANNGSLWVNRKERPLGVVPPEQVGETMERAMAALRAITDPASGRPVVTGFTDPAGGPLLPGRDHAVAFVELAADYQPSADPPKAGPVVQPATKTGTHVTNNGSDRLHAVFAAAGPGIPAGIDLGVLDNTVPAALALRRFGLGDGEAATLPDFVSPDRRPCLGGPRR
ncbi:MAG TPA: alkaline phosphatase family protein [Streptosporangiaceae bacterium]|nr:alkaline phosphatase family protein [Streptosporangiaceae bacterium]